MTKKEGEERHGRLRGAHIGRGWRFLILTLGNEEPRGKRVVVDRLTQNYSASTKNLRPT